LLSLQDLPSYPEDGGYLHNSYHQPGGGASEDQPFSEMEIRLMRQVSGFGFRIIGGQEEGSQVTGVCGLIGRGLFCEFDSLHVLCTCVLFHLSSKCLLCFLAKWKFIIRY